MIETTRTINNKVYDVTCFHPTAFENGFYVVRFHEHGQTYLDKFTHSISLYAPNELSAIEQAIKDINL